MFIHKFQNKEGEDVLSKANAKVELSLFWAVHSEALVFSFTERPLVWTILKHFLSCLYPLTFRHRSGKNSPINLWHHDTTKGLITWAGLLRCTEINFHDEPCWACLMGWADPANAITWKNLSPFSRDSDTAIPGSRLTGLARLSCNREVDFCCV